MRNLTMALKILQTNTLKWPSTPIDFLTMMNYNVDISVIRFIQLNRYSDKLPAQLFLYVIKVWQYIN